MGDGTRGGGKGPKMGKVSSDPPGPNAAAEREFSDKRGHSVRNYAAASAKKSTPPRRPRWLSTYPFRRGVVTIFHKPVRRRDVAPRDAFSAVVSYSVDPRLYPPSGSLR